MSEKLPDIEKIDRIKEIQPKVTEELPQDGKFASLMNQPASNEVQNSPQQASPMEMSAQNTKAVTSAPPTINEIQSQVQSVAGSLGDIKNQLHTKGLKLKQSDKYLLRSKLSSATDNIRSAAQNSGAPVGPAPDLSQKHSPIAKFLEMVTDGQRQLASAANEINSLNASGESISAGKLLLVQVKLQKAQQELDYSSTILGKSTEMIKTLMNVQI
jgi:hypothetical protein